MHSFRSGILLFILYCMVIPGRAQRNYYVNTMRFVGNKTLSAKVLHQQINTLPRKKIEKLLFWKKPQSFNLSTFEADINRLTSYYFRHGFPKTEISYAIDTVKYKLNVVIYVLESDFVEVEKVGVHLLGDAAVQRIVDSLHLQGSIKESHRFVDDHIYKTESVFKEGFSDTGYPFVEVNYSVDLNPDNALADIDFFIEPQKKCFFGDVTIHGDSLIPVKFIRKFITFSKGDLYSEQEMDETQQSLFDTELFLYVIIRSLKDSMQSDRIPVEVLVKELPRWELEFGVGFGTDDRLRLSSRLTRLNFLGGTRKLILKAKTSYFIPLGLDLKFVQPDLLLEDLDFALNPFFKREKESSHQIDRLGGRLSFIYRLNNNLSFDLSYTLERDEILPLEELQLDALALRHDKSIIGLGSNYLATNSEFYPSKGYEVGGNVAFAGIGFSDEIHYYQIQFAIHKYQELTDWLTLALRFKSGVIQNTLEKEETPIEERFYSGGASSLRGWPRHAISPLNEGGAAIGGNTQMEAGAEVRFPIVDIFDGVIFMDAGNVWFNSYQYDLNYLHYDTGVGVRIRSPIGPIRLDMASPIINDGFSFQFFISIGQTF